MTLTDSIATVDDLPATVYDAHRGGAGEAPENTLEAMHAAAPWVDVLDLDSQIAGDGTPVIMHDATVDRTTSSSGPVAGWGVAQWQLLRANPSAYFAAAAPDLPVPTVAQVLDQLGGQRVMTVEAKTAPDVAPLANLILTRGLQRSVLINTNDPAVAPEIKAAGCLAHLWRSAAQMATDDPAAIRATGADLLDVDVRATDAQIQAAVAQGYLLGVWAHTLTRRTERDRALTLGCRGIITDYPAYVSGRSPRRAASTFGTGFWGPGYVPTHGARPVLDADGRIPLPAPASVADVQVLLCGEVSEAPAETVVEMEFSFTTAGPAGWGLVHLHVGADDGPTALTSAEIVHDGYTAQVTANGSLRLYRDDRASGTSTQLLRTPSGPDLPAGTYTLRLAIVGQQLTVSVPEAGLSATATDGAHRTPWSVFVGRNYSSTAGGVVWVHSVTTT